MAALIPADEMIDRQRELEISYAPGPGHENWQGGTEPGVLDPLGARALYIYQGGRTRLSAARLAGMVVNR